MLLKNKKSCENILQKCMPYNLVGKTETVEQTLLLIFFFFLSFWKNVFKLPQWSQACDARCA